MMFQSDMKGWIPHFISNAFAAKAPAGWLENLSDYYWKVYSKKQQGQADGGQEKKDVSGAKAED